ncbi:MAG: HpcH/HpaI aldolase/citrate lyase family protein [Steroidobacterales bacterium]
MKLRSLLFVPGDRPDRMDKATLCGADALILDLEDAVSAPHKRAARGHCAEFLRGATRPRRVFVRINPLASGLARDDLASIAAARPDGIVLPKAQGAAAIRELQGLLPDAVRILPIATETPSAVFQLPEYASVAERLLGLTWGVEDLSAAMGASATRSKDGALTPPFEMLRALVLFAAHSAGIAAIDTVYTAFRDTAGLAAYAGRAARDGFTGMLAIHPDQVPVINAAFTPAPAAIARAERIVAAFRANPGAGVVSLDGIMLDAPHLKQAERVIALAAGD